MESAGIYRTWIPRNLLTSRRHLKMHARIDLFQPGAHRIVRAGPARLWTNLGTAPDGGPSSDATYGSAPDATKDSARNCTTTGNPIDPSSICAVRCVSGSAASDVSVSVDPMSSPGTSTTPLFAAHVVQTIPEACDQSFQNVQASWSGDFMNYGGRNDQWQFHLLSTVGSVTYGGGDANVEVYAIGADEFSGPVNVSGTLLCTIYTY